jgi:D-galactose 1-dehydrogenase
MAPIRIAVAGVGKIARDQHLPSIAGNKDFKLVAGVSRNATIDGVANFPDIDTLLAEMPDVEAVALCMPPGARHEAALKVLSHGKHAMLEKPPGATLSELDDLTEAAKREGVTLFATWHSRYAAGVPLAKDWLSSRTIRKVTVTWKEDVRKWHPGQAWIWEPGGFGVFDPGINALSIVTEIVPQPIFLTAARLVFPQNRAQPIAADLMFADASGTERVEANFDWRQTGPQSWEIAISTDDGPLLLELGGAKLTIGKEVVVDADNVEYAGIYKHFAGLVARRESDVDIRPLRHVADAFMIGRHETTDAFHD